MSLWATTQTLQKRLFKFLLKRTMGQFLATELDMDQLNVSLSLQGGAVNLSNVDLKVEALNELLSIADEGGARIVKGEVLSGRIGSIKVLIPWRDFWNANCTLDIEGLEITLVTDPEEKPVFNSVHSESLLLSSIHMAQDFTRNAKDLESEDEDEEKVSSDSGGEGLQVLAHLIDGIMSKIKVTLRDTVIRIRHTSKITGKTSLLIFNIPELEYHDETPGSEEINNNDTAINWNPPILIKAFVFNGFNVEHLEEVALPEDSDEDSASGSEADSGQEDEMGGQESGFKEFKEFKGKRSSPHPPAPSVILHAGSKDSLKIKLRQPSCTMSVPSIDADLFLRVCHICITPTQYHFLMELVDALLPNQASSETNKQFGYLSQSIHSSTRNFHLTEDDLPQVKPMGPADYERLISHVPGEDEEEYYSQDSFDSIALSDDEAEPPKENSQPKEKEASKPQTYLKFKAQIKESKLFIFAQDLEGSTGNDVIFDPEPISKNHIKAELTSIKLEYFDLREKREIDLVMKTVQASEYSLHDGEGAYRPLLGFISPEQLPDLIPQKKDRGTSSQPPDISLHITKDLSQTALEQQIDVLLKPLSLHLDLQIVDRFAAFFKSPTSKSNQAFPKPQDPRHGVRGTKHLTFSHPTLGDDDIMRDIDAENFRRSQLAHSTVSVRVPLLRAHLFAPRTISKLRWKEEADTGSPRRGPSDPHPLYEEMLILDLVNLKAGSESSSSSEVSKWDVSVQKINGYLKEPGQEQKLILSIFEDGVTQHTSFQLTIRPIASLIETVTEEYSKSRQKQKQSGPAKDHEADPIGFLHKAIQNSHMFLSCEIPVCVLNLTKHEFDVADTLLNELSEWEPKSLNEGDSQSGYTSEFFGLCAESDSESSDVETDTIVSEKVVQLETNRPKYNLFTLSADISTLSLILHESPFIQPDYLAPNPKYSYQLICNKIHSFKVNNYKGSDVSYFSVDLNDFILFDVTKHATGMSDNPLNYDFRKEPDEQLVVNELGASKIPILYRTRSPLVQTPQEMISVRVSTTRDMEADNKEIVANVFFKEVSLRHVYGSEWLFQLIDLLEEPDMPGLGHEFSTRFSKVSVLMSNISVDYKPIYSPTRTIIFIEEFKVTTNIIPGSPTLGIEFFFGNPGIYLINDVAYLNAHRELAKHFEEKHPQKVLNPWLKHWVMQGYTKVVEADSVQFFLRKTQGNEQYPENRLELTFKLGNIHLHTRGDSFQTLSDAISYYIDGLDLRPIEKDPSDQIEIPRSSEKLTSLQDEFHEELEEPHAPLEQEGGARDMLASVDEEMFGASIPIKQKLQMYAARAAKKEEEFTNLSDDHETMDFVEGLYPSLAQSIARPAAPQPSSSSLLDSFMQSPSSSTSHPKSFKNPLDASLEDIHVDAYIDDDLIGTGEPWDDVNEFDSPKTPSKGKGKEKDKGKRYLFDDDDGDADPMSRVPAGDVWIDEEQGERSDHEETPWDAPPDLEGSSQLEGFAAENAPDEIVRVLDDDSLNFKEDYFAAPKNSVETDEVKPPKDLPTVKILHMKFQIGKVVWKLYDGLEWESNRDEEKGIRTKRSASMNSEEFMMEKEDSRQHFEDDNVPLFQASDELASHSSQEFMDKNDFPQELESPTFEPAPERPKDRLRPAEEFDRFDEIESDEFWEQYSKETANKIDDRNRALKPRELHSSMDMRFDQINVEYETYPAGLQYSSRLLALVKDVKVFDNIETSSWRTFLTHMINENAPRETGSNMVHYEMIMVHPDPGKEAEEARLKIKLLPLRLYVDQDAFEFLRWFFTYESPIASQKAKQRTGPQPKPVDPTFFQQVELRPISLKMDYKPKVMNVAGLAEGKIEELGNLFRLEGAEVNLMAVKLNGLAGWAKLIEGMVNTWKPHFKNLIPGIASGVAPVRSLVNVGSAALDLLLLPVQQYKKDGRFVYGLQKAAASFLKTTTVETINLGTKILVGTQVILVAVDRSVTGGETKDQPVDQKARRNSKQPSIYSKQPSSLSEGLQQGFENFTTNLGSAAFTLYRVPQEVYERRGAQEALKNVVYALPSAVLRPAIGATNAVSKTLMGLRNSLSPSTKQELDEKYGTSPDA